MHRLLYLALLGLTGCPPPPRYVVADVYARGAPLPDALVSAYCAEPHVDSLGRARGPALRTDELGRAYLTIRGKQAAHRCSLTVAKPGFSTVEVDGLNICSTPAQCPPVAIDLDALHAPPGMIELEPPRGYSQPERGYSLPPGVLR